MALQGFDKDYYLGAKLTALQAEFTEWVGKDAAFLEDVLLNVYSLTPEDHYSQWGHTEGLAPNTNFNAAEYKLAKATALFNAGEYLSITAAQTAFEAAWTVDPYQHYLQWGSAEGVNPSNSFDESSYLDSKLAALQADAATSTEWAGKTAADVRASFTAAGLSALGHFVDFGSTEGLTVTPVPEAEQVTSDDGSSGVTGDTFTLTTGLDSLTGTANNDSFLALQDTVANGGTYQAADNLNGGSGTDTLTLTNSQGAAANAAVLSNIENLVYRASAAAGHIALSDFAGVTDVTLSKFVGGTNVTDVLTSHTITFAESTATADTTMTYLATGVTGAADSATVSLNGLVAASDLELVGAVETVTVKTVTAASALADLVFDGSTTALTINADENLTVATTFTAAGAVTLTATGDSTIALGTLGALAVGAATTTIDASAMTDGGLQVTGHANTTAMTGGAGDDILIAGAVGTVLTGGAGDDILQVAGVPTAAVAGGDGTDTLSLLGGTGLTTTTAALFSGFEKLRAASHATTYDLSLEAGLVDLEIDFSAAADATFTSATDGLNMLVRSDANTQNLVVSILNAGNPGTANTATLTLDHLTANTDIDISGVDMAGLETLSIVSTGVVGAAAAGTTNSIADVDGSTVLKTINISGDAHFTLTDIGANNTVVDTVNASTLTGNLTFAATNGGSAVGIAVTGGSGADNITGDDGTDVLVGGAGNDTLNGADGIDSITGGAGTDTHVIATEATLAAILASRDIVTDFTIGTDDIDYNGGTANITALTGAVAFGAANSIQTHSTSGNLTVNGNARVVAITVEDATTLSTDGASVLDALVTGVGVGTITVDAGNDAVLFLLDDGTNTGLYLGASDVGGGADTAIIQAEISLIGTYNSLTADQFTIADFV